MSIDVPWRKDITTEEVKFENGEMFISDKPGLGIDLNIEEILKHPFEAREVRHYKGTLTEIRPADAESYFTK